MEWYEIVGYLLGAFGGSAALVRLIRAIADWRRGVQQREAAPTERLVIHLEQRIKDMGGRVSWLEAAREADGAYISMLVFEMARAGMTIPPRPKIPGA